MKMNIKYQFAFNWPTMDQSTDLVCTSRLEQGNDIYSNHFR